MEQDNIKVSLYEEDIYKTDTPKEEMVSLVTFRLDSEWYGVPILTTLEVLRIDKITYLPSAPSFIAGIINVRGNILSITDLKNIFGLSPSALSDKTRVVVIHKDDIETGLLIDEITEILTVPLSKIEPPLATIPASLVEYFKGAYKSPDRLIAILNVEKLLEKGEGYGDQ
jgi:purine-binding chemotaxis protein CheW